MRKGIVIVGAGGHAKVCVESLRARGEDVAFCVGSVGGGTECLGVPVLEGDEHIERLRQQGYERAFIALGSNGLRARLADVVVGHGYKLVNAVHPQAVVSPTARIGEGVAIMAGVVINADATIGDLSIINTGATVDHDCVIGTAVHIGPQSALAGTVTVGDRAFLGAGSRVIPGMAIGAGATIGAGGVVITPVEEGATAVGVPTRVIKQKNA
jgi:UDP-perosamine 4-acetyltransferase